MVDLVPLQPIKGEAEAMKGWDSVIFQAFPRVALCVTSFGGYDNGYAAQVVVLFHDRLYCTSPPRLPKELSVKRRG
jgi:hypothetical protein